jgi:serine protease Do
MVRSVTLALAASAILLILSPAATTAGGDGNGEQDRKVEKKVERKVIVLPGHREGSFLGVRLEDVEGPDARGAVVRGVDDDSPAAKAGLEKGDVVLRFDGEEVRGAVQLGRLVRETPAGRSVPIEVRRDGSSRTLTATLATGSPRWISEDDEDLVVPDRDFDVTVPEPLPPHVFGVPGPPPGPYVFKWRGRGDRGFGGAWSLGGRPRLGIRYMEIGEQLAEYFGVTKDAGVLVTAVDEGSPAARAGLKAGDVILEFGGKPVGRDHDLRARVAEAGSGPVAVKVQRHGKPVDLEVTLPAEETPPHDDAGVSL